MTDMKLHVGHGINSPDVMVCCDEPATENPVFRTDACLLTEAHSSGTPSAASAMTTAIREDAEWQ